MLYKLLKQNGGMHLVWSFFKNGLFHNVILQLFASGFSRKSLEILRLTIQVRINKKLQKKYLKDLNTFNENYSETTNSQSRKVIWVCWMQGIEKAPLLVQKCFNSLKKNITDRDIILITSHNIDDYVHMPVHIMNKYKEGKITHTHFSDLLRIELLTTYGGTWIDSTVLCTGTNIPTYMFESDLFMFQNLKPGADGSTLNISSWFITSKANNKILMAVKYLLYRYWETHNTLIDYFLLHHFIEIVKNYYRIDWDRIIQFPNSTPHILLLSLFKEYDANTYQYITQMCPFHKLAYKRSKEDLEKENTYYQYILKNF